MSSTTTSNNTTSSVANAVKKNLDFVRDNTQLNLDFVYLQLDNVRKLVGNEEFLRELMDTLEHVLDRNEDGYFDGSDVKLLRDIFTNKNNLGFNIYNFVSELLNSCLALVAKVEKPMVKMNKEAVEGLFFGTLTYCLFQFSPQDRETKMQLVDLVVSIYSILQTVDNTLGLTKRILKFLKRKGWLKCLYKDQLALEREVLRSRERVRGYSRTLKQTERSERALRRVSTLVPESTDEEVAEAVAEAVVETV